MKYATLPESPKSQQVVFYATGVHLARRSHIRPNTICQICLVTEIRLNPPITSREGVLISLYDLASAHLTTHVFEVIQVGGVVDILPEDLSTKLIGHQEVHEPLVQALLAGLRSHSTPSMPPTSSEHQKDFSAPPDQEHDPFQCGGRFPWPEMFTGDEVTNYYLYLHDRHLCIIGRPSPSTALMDGFRFASIDLALVEQPGVLFLGCRIANHTDWIASPYNWHLMGGNEKRLSGTVEHLPLHLLLVDSTTKKIVVRREVHLPSSFAQALHNALQRQAKDAFDFDAFNLRLQRILEEFPLDIDLIKLAQTQCIIPPVTQDQKPC